MTETQKQRIKECLDVYCQQAGSANKASNSLRNISSATISQVLNNNWELISDEMWRNIASQTGYSEDEWVEVEIRDYKLLTALLEDSQNHSNVFAVVGDSGTGKSATLRRYAQNNKRVFIIQCAEYWNRKIFLQELMSAMGRDYSGYNVNEMMHEIVRGLKTQDHPLIIMDEADKLVDQVLYFFITLYNQLEDHCGIVLCSTDHMAKRIKHGLKLNRKGYKEIYSRIARKFIELKGLSSSDVAAICMANGVTERNLIKDVIEDSEGDLRRIRRKIHALKSAQ